jgi:hypothetical protein
MKVLFDQNVPTKLRRFLRLHWTTTAAELGWSELKNGDLLAIAESAGFEILITCDQNLEYQQNLSGRKIAVLGTRHERLEDCKGPCTDYPGCHGGGTGLWLCVSQNRRAGELA